MQYAKCLCLALGYKMFVRVGSFACISHAYLNVFISISLYIYYTYTNTFFYKKNKFQATIDFFCSNFYIGHIKNGCWNQEMSEIYIFQANALLHLACPRLSVRAGLPTVGAQDRGTLTAQILAFAVLTVAPTLVSMVQVPRPPPPPGRLHS